MQNFEFFLGIDPGKTGGLINISPAGIILNKMVMGSIEEVISWLNFNHLNRIPGLAIIEKAQAMPKNGAVSMFNYGVGYGELLGALAALRIAHMAVPSPTWTKKMHQGLSRSVTAKERSRKAFEMRFPGIDLRASDKCKKPHEGLVDAILLAEYGRLCHNGDRI